MSAEENKAFMRRFIEAGNKQDMVTIWECMDPRCHLPNMEHFGLEPTFAGYQRFLAAFYTALPDAFLDAEEMIAEGDQVCVWYTIGRSARVRAAPESNHKAISASDGPCGLLYSSI